MRGWTPAMTDNGVAWISPSCWYFPPKLSDRQPPVYTEWLGKYIHHCLRIQYIQSALKIAATAAPRLPSSESAEPWDDDNIPEPPAGMFPSAEDDEILTQMAIESHLLEHASDDLREN